MVLSTHKNLRGGGQRRPFNFRNYGFELNKNDTTVLKAISIILIVFHNYWHNVFGAPGENEHSFSPSVIGRVWDALLNNPFDFIHPLTSFFGHYGVHMFIFLSGYGLTKKLISMSIESPSGREEWKLCDIYKQIVVRQILKIFKLILVGLVFLILVRFIQSGSREFLEIWFWKGFLVFCTFTQNFRPNRLLSFCSVWWFLALIVQLYVLFPLLVMTLRKHPEKSLFALLALTMLCGAVSGPILMHWHIYIFATPFAQALLFAFGIYCAMGYKLPRCFYLAAFIVFPFSWKFASFFPLSFIAMVLVSLFLYQKFKAMLNSPWLIYIGQLSMFIYITHGDVRWPLLQAVNQSKSLYVAYVMFFGYLIFCFALAWLCRVTARALHLLK